MENLKAFKRKMLLWTSSWSHEDFQESADQVSFIPDAMEIAYLLQAVGYRIRFMDRCLSKEMYPVPEVSGDCPACRVILMCPRSGIRIELDAQTSSCRCPIPDKSDLGQSWTASEPRSEEMAKAVDSLGPRPSTEITKSVSQLIGGLFQVLSLFPDQNHNNLSGNIGSGISLTKKEMQQEKSADTTMKTPATGIAVVTPNAPCIPKISPGESKSLIPGRYRSLDTLIGFGSVAHDLPEPGQLTPKDDAKSEQETGMEIDGEIETQRPESESKKFISKSSPAVNCTTEFERSDTFDFESGKNEENLASKENLTQKLLRSNTYISGGTEIGRNIEEEPRAGPPPRKIPSPLITPTFSQSSIVLGKLQEIQLAVSDVIFMVAGDEKNLVNIGDVSKASKAVAGAVKQRLITDNTVRPIRCLSDFGSVPNLNRAATTVRSIPRPNMRRSMNVGTLATPTTSRRLGTNTIERTKKCSTTATLSKSTIAKVNSNRQSISNNGNSMSKISPLTSPMKNNASISKNSDKRSNLQPAGIPKPTGTARK